MSDSMVLASSAGADSLAIEPARSNFPFTSSMVPPGAVLHQELLAKDLRQLIGNDARNESCAQSNARVATAARRNVIMVHLK
jgi:hypothetical protein